MLSELSLICAVISTLVALASAGGLLRSLNMAPHFEILHKALDDYRIALEMERGERARLAIELATRTEERDQALQMLSRGSSTSCSQ